MDGKAFLLQMSSPGLGITGLPSPKIGNPKGSCKDQLLMRLINFSGFLE